MDEGEEPFATDFPIRKHDLDYDDDEREVYYYEYGQEVDNDEDEQEVDTTRPFYPGSSSTPYHGGEQLEMQTMMHEQSGLPDTSYEETPFFKKNRFDHRSSKRKRNKTKNKKVC